MKDKILYIVRGIPGSGKSTLSKTLGGEHYEADMYFVDKETKEYKFDVTKLKDAHNWCQMIVEESMNYLKDERIVVSNTFTQEWEMQPYFELAEKYNYTVFTIIVENRHDGVNQHNVPEDKIQLMRDRFEIKL
jgi:predicted kinase